MNIGRLTNRKQTLSSRLSIYLPPDPKATYTPHENIQCNNIKFCTIWMKNHDIMQWSSVWDKNTHL